MKPSGWWDANTLKCSCCQNDGSMRDMTINDDDHERFLWCTRCGAVCRPNVGDPISLHDWYFCVAMCPTDRDPWRHKVTGRMD